MVQTRRKGALRYLLLAIIPQSLSGGLEAMGDRAVLAAGEGQGAGTPYYLPALILTLVAAGLCLFALKRLFERLTGKDGNAAQKPEIVQLEETYGGNDGFDPDAIVQRYIEQRQTAPAPGIATPRTGGFGKKGL